MAALLRWVIELGRISSVPLRSYRTGRRSQRAILGLSPAQGVEGKPGPFAAACMMQLEKRTAALIPPEPLKRQWQAGAAPA